MSAESSKTLVYRTVPHNGGIVFALRDRGEYVASIHRALRSATTWAELRALLPRQEYSKIIAALLDSGEPRPQGKDQFDAEQIPGWSDGDYPPWLQQEMSVLLSLSLLRRFGTLKVTAVNGSYWHIPPENLAGILRGLEESSYSVTHAPDLDFH